MSIHASDEDAREWVEPFWSRVEEIERIRTGNPRGSKQRDGELVRLLFDDLCRCRFLAHPSEHALSIALPNPSERLELAVLCLGQGYLLPFYWPSAQRLRRKVREGRLPRENLPEPLVPLLSEPTSIDRTSISVAP